MLGKLNTILKGVFKGVFWNLLILCVVVMTSMWLYVGIKLGMFMGEDVYVKILNLFS